MAVEAVAVDAAGAETVEDAVLFDGGDCCVCDLVCRGSASDSVLLNDCLTGWCARGCWGSVEMAAKGMDSMTCIKERA